MSIRLLRRTHPTLAWKAERHGFGWQYRASNGWHAYWVSALAPQYPDDDSTCRSELWIYKDTTHEPPALVVSGANYRT